MYSRIEFPLLTKCVRNELTRSRWDLFFLRVAEANRVSQVLFLLEAVDSKNIST